MAHGLCRLCGAELNRTVIDLGMAPMGERFLRSDQLDEMEPFYPLHVRVCEDCWLVQLSGYGEPAEIFSDYLYFSSFADARVREACAYADQIAAGLRLDGQSQVIEVASNDGYLLAHFAAKGIPVLGVEPAAQAAEAARARGVSTMVCFFGRQTASELADQGKQADLLIGNNVLMFIPDLHDFAAGLKTALKPQGVLSLEIPYLPRQMAGNQFDFIYHENVSYFSFLPLERLLAIHGLDVFDAESLDTFGGSLRVYARHRADASRPATPRVASLREEEEMGRASFLDHCRAFAERVAETRRALLSFLVTAKGQGKTVAGYGASGKANSLLNYCGIREDLLAYLVDRNPLKQGRFTPGTHIPIHAPEKIRHTKPDYLLILSWNYRDEIQEQMAFIRDWGGRFVVAFPEVKVVG